MIYTSFKPSDEVVIIGLGKTGLSCAKHLANLGLNFSIVDSRNDPPCYELLREAYPTVKVYRGDFDEKIILNADCLVVSQGVSLLEPVLQKAKQKGIPRLSDLELFARYCQDHPMKIIAITGTNGKSTVTTLVGEMAKQAGLSYRIGGNLGTPVLDLITSPAPDYTIIEVSNFQLELVTTLFADVSVLLNIAPDHLDCYHHYEDYITAKHQVFTGASRAVVGAQQPLIHVPKALPTLSFGQTKDQADFYLGEHQGEQYFYFREQPIAACSRFPLVGTHNRLNALAALAIGHSMNLSFEAMVEALQGFDGLSHRSQLVGKMRGITWINDSKGTNVAATLAAIDGLAPDRQGQMILIAGGVTKGADFSPLVPAIQNNVKTVILYGRDILELERVMVSACDEVAVADSMEQAVWMADKQAEPGDIVLFSPACASFDYYENFAKRGEHFCHAVREFYHENRE